MEISTLLENIKEPRLRQLKDKNNELFTRASGKFTDTLDERKFKEFYEQYFDEVGLITYSERWNTYSNDIDPNDNRPCGLPFEDYIYGLMEQQIHAIHYKSYLTLATLSRRVLGSAGKIWVS